MLSPMDRPQARGRIPVTIPCALALAALTALSGVALAFEERHVYLGIAERTYDPAGAFDYLAGPGHADGHIPAAERRARTISSLTFRRFHDPGFLLPMHQPILAGDPGEPHEPVPGAVIHAVPGDRLLITLYNSDTEPHALVFPDLRAPVIRDGGRARHRADEAGRPVAPGDSGTYALEVTADMLGAWLFRDGGPRGEADTARGLFGGLIVLDDATLLPMEHGPGDDELALLETFRRHAGGAPLHASTMTASLWSSFDDTLEFIHELKMHEADPASAFGAEGGSGTQLVTLFFHVLDGGGSFPHHRFTPAVNGRGFLGNTPVVDVAPGRELLVAAFRVQDELVATPFVATDAMEAFAVEQERPHGLLLRGRAPGTPPAPRSPRVRPFIREDQYLFALDDASLSGQGMVGMFRTRTLVGPEPDRRPALLDVQPRRHDLPPSSPPPGPGDGTWEEVPGHPWVQMIHAVLLPGTSSVLYWGYQADYLETSWIWDGEVGQYRKTANQAWELLMEEWGGLAHDPQAKLDVGTPLPSKTATAVPLPTGSLTTLQPTVSGNATLFPDEYQHVFEAYIGANLLSSQHVVLDTPAGDVLVHGGFARDPESTDTFVGSFLFDPQTERWRLAGRTRQPRWYSTTIPLGYGSVGTFLGMGLVNGDKLVADSVEYFDGQGWFDSDPATILEADWIKQPASVEPDPDPAAFKDLFDVYPWAFLLPDGDVFLAGPMQPSRVLDLDDMASSPSYAMEQDLRTISYGSYGTVVMLPLEADAPEPRFLAIAGNTQGQEKNPMASVESINLSDTPPAWEEVDPLNTERHHPTAVLLPNEKVFVTGGSKSFVGETPAPGELLDLTVTDEDGTPIGAWQEVAAPASPHAYHSTALLLPDGSVLVGGDPWALKSTHKSKPRNLPVPHERWFPPYFDGPRPEITGAPATVAPGDSFTLASPQAGSLQRVLLMSPSSVTHGLPMNQRAVALSFDPLTASSLDVAVPANEWLVPRGHYLLFVVDGGRIPSEGRWIRISD